MKNAIKLALAALVITAATGCSGLATQYEAHVDRLNEKHAENPNFENYSQGSNWHYYDNGRTPYGYAIGS